MLTRNPSIVMASRPTRTRPAAKAAPKQDAPAPIVRKPPEAAPGFQPAAPATRSASRPKAAPEPDHDADALRAAAERVWAKVSGKG